MSSCTRSSRTHPSLEADKCVSDDSATQGTECMSQRIVRINKKIFQGHNHGRPTSKANHGRPTSNAARERSRVKTLRSAFLNLQLLLPAVPPDTKLSKLDVLLLATAYISHLRNSLFAGQTETDGSEETWSNGEVDTPRAGHLQDTIDRHPVKKWPMRSRLYEGILGSTSARNTGNIRVSRCVDRVCKNTPEKK